MCYASFVSSDVRVIQSWLLLPW